jgi:hypothetical protein
MEIDPIAPGGESGNADDVFDRAIWKDRQDILQTFDISVRTLQRWRDAGLRMRKFNRKYFYHIGDATSFFQEMGEKKEKLNNWPISLVWTGFWIAETIMIFTAKDGYMALFTLPIPLIIAVPADIIIRIRKRREKKQAQ